VFRKILIANRGEIAVRILRACRELAIPTVAVYSEADRRSLHVQLADEALPIGPPAPSESYLRVDALLDAARRAGADAIHPGYGFLAESAEFSRACAGAGIRFIGPGAEAIERMGDKLQARRSVERLGVPLVPGTLGESLDPDALVTSAEEIGFPVMLKAVGGGGGKGMRVVSDPSDLPGAVETAGSEAHKAFGRADLYVERYVEPARHVEVQVARDRGGRTVHLFERECSVQRRHQKLIEEAPAAIPASLRDRMTDAAVRIAEGIGYENLGTVEFLVCGDDFFFLEMNTRLQVEHPVTEMITGKDLVKLQIAIAAGEPIPFAQEDVATTGHAVEARVCAEDPQSSFFPSVGRVRELVLPGGPDVRVDTDLCVGSEVTLFYDPLVAKVIARGSTRDEALDRLAGALRELRVVGVRTTAGLLARVSRDDTFRKEGYDTGYLPRFLEREAARAAAPGPRDPAGADDSGRDVPDPATLVRIAAVLAAHADGRRAGAARGQDEVAPREESPWVREGRAAQMRG